MAIAAKNRVAPAGETTHPVSRSLRDSLCSRYASFPYRVCVSDWTGASFEFGGHEPHWFGQALNLHFRTPVAARAAADLNGFAVLEHFRNGDVDMTGNLYLLSELREFLRLRLSVRQFLGQILKAKLLQFQDPEHARQNVKTHYDIPQEAINLYLDQVYMAYSCAMFEDPGHFDVAELTRVGTGQFDTFDSLEKAQWRKFRDAVDFLEADEGETLLDVGCGYGGQLAVALESPAFSKVVGWTLSSNQVREGRRMLEGFDHSRWELNEGDYRQDGRVFDHITSTGMISHVGPRGLVPYVRNIRRRIKKGGRYVHHAIMVRHQRRPLDLEVGIAFNKRFVWPGFHWFTLGQHTRALEMNGFVVTKSVNLAPHYGKTVAAWYERMMVNRDEVQKYLGEAGFRAWQVYLAGGSQGLSNGTGHVYRLYCEAV